MSEDRYELLDWTPPWLDNGKSLLRLITEISKLCDEEKSKPDVDPRFYWQIFAVLLVDHLNYDLAVAREVNKSLEQ